MTKNYDIADVEKVTIIKNWLGSNGLYFPETQTTEEQEACNSSTGLPKCLMTTSSCSTMKPFKYCKLLRY